MKRLEIKDTIAENYYTSTALASTVKGAAYTVDGTEHNIEAAEGNALVLVVDGIQVDLLKGCGYDVEKDFEIIEMPVYKIGGPKAAPWLGLPEDEMAAYYFRQALLVRGGEIIGECSIPGMIHGGSYDSKAAEGITIISNGTHFNGIVLDDGAKYELENSRVEAHGDGGDDLEGWGACIMADNGTKLDISDSYIESEGAVRCCLYTSNGSVVRVKDSVMYSIETPDTYEEFQMLVPGMMKRVPFALGMEGTVRTLNVMGDAQGIFEDSIIVSTGWGALSCDSGTAYDICHTYCIDCSNVLSGIGRLEVAQEGKEYTAVREIGGVKYGFTVGGSGYVTYADSGVHNRYKNVEFYAPDYIQVMGSGRSGSAYIDSYLCSGHTAFMTQQSGGGTYELTGTKVDTVDALLQIKSGKANTGFSDIIVDNCEINFSGASTRSEDGILVELVESDDAGNPGITEAKIEDHPEEAVATLSSVADCHAEFKNGSYKGDIFNCIYNYRQVLNVLLKDAALTGKISASQARHVDLEGNPVPNGTVLHAFLGSVEYDHARYDAELGGQSGDALIIGRYCHSAAPVLNNPVNLTIEGGKWNVTGDCYLRDLTADSLSDICAEAPVTVTVKKLTVGGIECEDGSYNEGNVTFVVDSTEIEVEDNGICDAGQTYGNVVYTFYAKTEGGDLDSSAFTVKRQNYIDGKLYYTLFPAEGYEILSVSSEGGVINKNMNDAEELSAYEFEIAPEDGASEMSLMVTVKH